MCTSVRQFLFTAIHTARPAIITMRSVLLKPLTIIQVNFGVKAQALETHPSLITQLLAVKRCRSLEGRAVVGVGVRTLTPAALHRGGYGVGCGNYRRGGCPLTGSRRRSRRSGGFISTSPRARLVCPFLPLGLLLGGAQGCDRGVGSCLHRCIDLGRLHL